VLEQPVSRRHFLAGTGALAVATLVDLDLLAGTADASSKALSALTVSIDPYASPRPQRIAMVLYQGAKSLSGPALQVALAPPGSNEATVYRTKLSKASLPDAKGIYLLEPTLAQAGNWTGVALVQGKKVPFALQVKAKAEVPTVGTPAPRAASPTTANALGVQPICTRHPVCPLHSVSLADVVGAGKPVAVMFATPALCQFARCGPVLDQLLKIRGAYQDRIAFVHVEIYRSNKGTDVAPTVAAWNLPGEPWLFTIDGKGVVKDRLDGAFGRDEMKQALDALLV
jgi:hypothetical protein